MESPVKAVGLKDNCEKPVFKVVYKIIGIPVFSVIHILDEDDLYERMAKRFKKEFESSLKNVRP